MDNHRAGRSLRSLSAPLLAAAIVSVGCGSHVSSTREASAPQAGSAASARSQGTHQLDEHVRYALTHSPALEASYEDWRAAELGVKPSGRLPDPKFSYAYFVRSVETRVGPQRHKLGLTQTFPWPGKLSGQSDAAALRSESVKRQYEASALEVMRQVSEEYWKAWLIDRSMQVEQERQALLSQLAASTRARVEIGQASAADLSQVNLALSRTADRIDALKEQRTRALADLRAAMGAPDEHALTIDPAPPRVLRLSESEQALVTDAQAHPRITAMSYQADAHLASADSTATQGYPDFTLGVEYIETGGGTTPAPDDGKDPIIAMLSVSLPIWSNVSGTHADAERASSRALKARQRALQLNARAATQGALSGLRDSARQVHLYDDTLMPQAKAMYESVLGSYQTGQSTLAAVLLANQQLLELSEQRYRAQANHALNFARLEALVGRPVKVHSGADASPAAAPAADPGAEAHPHEENHAAQ